MHDATKCVTSYFFELHEALNITVERGALLSLNAAIRIKNYNIDFRVI